MHLLEDGGAFVDFVEHAHIDRLGARLDVAVELLPVELAAEAEARVGGVAVGIAVVRMHVAVAAAREHVRGVHHDVTVGGVLLRLGDVVLDPGQPLAAFEVVVAVTAHVPGDEGVALLDDLDHLAVLGPAQGVVAAGPPVTRAAQHDGPALGLELLDVRLDERGLGQVVVVETESPEGQQRLPVLVQVVLLGAAVLEVVLVHQLLGVGDHALGHVLVGRTAHVVHHGDGAAVLVGALHRVLEHGVEMVLVLRILDFAHEPLHEHAVQSVLLHPLEVREHRGFVIGAEHGRVRAVRKDERRAVAGRVAVAHHILLRVLGHVRPEVDGVAEDAGAELLAFAVVVPALVRDRRHRRPVARRAEPALVARHDEAAVRVVRLPVLVGLHARIGILRLTRLRIRLVGFHPPRDHLLRLLAGEGDHERKGGVKEFSHHSGTTIFLTSERFQLV